MSPTSYRTAPPRGRKDITLTRDSGSGKGARGAKGLARFDVADDEQLLTRPDQAEIAAGDLLDRRGILA